MIEGVEILDKKRIPDERGTVSHFVTYDEVHRFGECYITTVYDGIIKGWHGYLHKTMWYCVPQGMVHLVLWDFRTESPTDGKIEELFLGDSNYKIVKIPPRVMNSFKGIARPISTVVVVADEKFDETRTLRLPLDYYTCPYEWK